MLPALKIVLVGETRVGKSCILDRRLNDTFEEQIPNTIGTAFSSTFLQTDAGNIRLQLWDTAGQEQYASLASMYYRNAHVALLVFDLTSASTFLALRRWAREVKEKAPPSIRIILVGNKADLVSQRAVKLEDIDEFRGEIGALSYVETSAKTGAGIELLFRSMGKLTAAAPEVTPHKPAAMDTAKKGNTDGCC
jgi:small GTP-binding protein